MKNRGGINYIKHSEIDTDKWDKCIENAANRRVYAFHWYLDRTAIKWDALVIGDYKYVMPLPVRKKWGIKYVYQPVYCQQLGIFPDAPEEIQKQFTDVLTSNFRFTNFQVNTQTIPSAFSKFQISQKENFVLPLIDSYSALSSQYRKRARQNIATASKNGVKVVKGMNTGDYIELKKKHVIVNVSPESYHNLAKLISFTQTKGNGMIMAAYTPANEFCAAAFFLHSGNRLTYLNAFSTEEGKKHNAMYAIIDEFIREHAETGYLLDFEGSSIKGVAHFYKSFGSFSETYYLLYLNRLPFPLNLFKRNKA